MYQHLPFIEVSTEPNSSWEGWDAIQEEIRHAIGRIDTPLVVVAVECYHGTLDEANFQELKKRLQPAASCKASDLYRENEELKELISRRMVGNSHPGKFTGLSINDYFDPQKLLSIQHSISSIGEGVVLIYGIGATAVWDPALLIYADMSHWEIQQRLRRGDIGNIGLKNSQAPFGRKYEISFYNDWQVCNQMKRELIGRCDYFLETNNWARPKLAAGATIRQALEQAMHQPVKTAPFFDPELWDAHSDRSSSLSTHSHMEWWFSCVPEEDNLLFRLGNLLFETPLLNLVFYKPENFLGPEVVRQFGAYLPIRFYFVDTTENQDTDFLLNPITREITDSLGSCYRQATSYYLLQAQAGAKLELAIQENGSRLLKFKKLGLQQHDFVQIPAGISFRAGKKLMAVQINTAPQIYSVKLQQLTPREGFASDFPNIVRYKETSSPSEQEEILSNDIILVARSWFSRDIEFHTDGKINILMLVAGDAVVAESPDGLFQPFMARYGETFIVPAMVGAFRLRPLGDPGQRHAILRATPIPIKTEAPQR